MKQTILLAFFSICSISASAQVLLKPSGQGAAPLATKAIVADVEIKGQFASTTLNLTFQNQVHGQVEADFFYTLPPETAVTYFAYWFKDEKVVARVVEKERAAAIYSHITSRMRDPALIEMVGKNKFRARIFPVEANADLRVEMKLVQTLPADPSGATYELPLYQEKGQPLDSVAIRVRVHPDDLTIRVENNLGISVLTDQAGYRFAIEGRNYRPQKDLRVRLVRTPSPLQASLFSARSGGADGFFALAVVSAKAITNPVLMIDRMRTFQLAPPSLKDTKGNSAYTIYGRYKGSGRAVIRLSGRSESGPITLTETVQFADSAESNNLAAKLWAYHRIESLSDSERNRAAVVELSKRHTLPSKFTSWLAVPHSEMERYRAEKLQAEVYSTTARLVRELDHSGPGRNARKLRQRLDELCLKTKDDPDSLIRGHVSSRLYTLAQPVARDEVLKLSGPRARASRSRYIAFCRRFGVAPEPALQEQRGQAAYEEASKLAGRLAKAIFDEQGDTPKARELRLRIHVMLPAGSGYSAADLISGHLQSRTHPLAAEIAAEERATKPDLRKIALLTANLERIEREGGIPAGGALRGARMSRAHTELNDADQRIRNELKAGSVRGESLSALRQLLQRLDRDLGPQDSRQIIDGSLSSMLHRVANAMGTEVASGRADASRQRQFRASFDEISRMAGLDPQAQIRTILAHRLQSIATGLANERHRPNPDEAAVSRMESELARLSSFVGEVPMRFTEEAERPFRIAGDLKLRDELIAARRDEKPDARRIQELEDRFRKSAWRQEYTNWRLERIAVEVELDKLEKLPKADLQRQERLAERLAFLTERDRELRARMGDPLIQIEAPADSKDVIALMPGGEVKRLFYNTDSRRWEARFDIPGYAAEGVYEITIIVVHKDGSRSLLVMRYHVDVTPPEVNGFATQIAGSRKLRLELESDANTARVSALLPWGEKVELRATPRPGQFYTLTQVPESFAGSVERVTYVVTDRAHNRTVLTVDLAEGR